MKRLTLASVSGVHLGMVAMFDEMGFDGMKWVREYGQGDELRERGRNRGRVGKGGSFGKRRAVFYGLKAEVAVTRSCERVTFGLFCPL